MTKTAFVKIDTPSGKDYFLQTELEDDGKEGFQLMLTDGEQVWTGKLSEDDLDELSTKAKMDYNTFVAQTVKAFTQESLGGLQFEFKVKTENTNTVDFIWKKFVPADDIKFQLGSVALRVQHNTDLHVRLMFQQCITCITGLQRHIRSLNTDNERLSEERAKALKRLDKCVTAKEEVERDLYEKFVAVLNSKKEKIRTLKRQVEEGIPASVTGNTITRDQEDSDDEDIDDSIPSSTRLASPRDEDEDTDEESKPGPSKRQRRAPAVKKEADSSLVLEDEADTATTAVARRPARQRAGAKKQTPSKPVLPKVTSKRSDSGSSGDGRRSSMRKSSSNNSNRSSDYQDADELMGELE